VYPLLEPLDSILSVLTSTFPDLSTSWLGGVIEVTLLAVVLGLPVLSYAVFGGLMSTLVARFAVAARINGEAGGFWSRTPPHLAAADDGPDRGTE
jgi:hypothetical protein